MIKLLKLIAYLVLLAAVGLGALAFIARFMDGPVAIFPGGALTSGEWHGAPVGDWEFAADIETIELQLEGEASSRTVWVVVDDGAAYIPCSLSFPPGKNWYTRAQRDGAAIVRIDGTRYRVALSEVTADAEAARVSAAVASKYQGLPPGDAGALFFRLSSRA